MLMKRLIALALTLLLIVPATLQAQSKPDFAYPKTVIADSRRAYDSAAVLKGLDADISLIKSLLDMTVATGEINSDSLSTMLPLIASQASDNKRLPATRAILETMQAELLMNIYNQQRWQYDRVNSPDEPIPTDITEWSGRQFKTVITRLCDKALADAAEAPRTALRDYEKVISANSMTYKYFPTVADFVSRKAADTFSSLGDDERRRDIIRAAAEASQKGSAPYFYWMTALCNDMPVEESEDDLGDSQKRRNPLEQLYLDNRANPEADYVLSRVADRYYEYAKDEAWLVDALRETLAKRPDGLWANSLQNALNRLTRPNVEVTAPSIVAPGNVFDVKLKYGFSGKCGFTIYKLTAEQFANRSKLSTASLRTIAKHDFNTGNTTALGDTTVSVTLEQPGYYMLLSSLDGRQGSINNAVCIRVSRIIPVMVSDGDKRVFAVTDYVSGKPVAGVSVSRRISRGPWKVIGKTDADGLIRASMPETTDKNRWASVSYRFTCDGVTMNFNNLSDNIYERDDDDDVTVRGIMLTDRQLYHPGDSIAWAAVIGYGDNVNNATIAPDLAVKVYLYDANNQTVDSVATVTDRLGRVNGRFVTPQTGLNGSFRLSVFIDGGKAKGNYAASRTVTVSDFRMPVFELTNLSVSRDVPAKGSVTLSGKAVTYTGMPVSSAAVDAEIIGAMRWRWFTPSRTLGRVEGRTDAEGRFSIVVGDSLLAGSGFDNFIAKITVTDAASSIAQASRNFTTGRPYTITAGDINNAYDSAESIKAPVIVTDADGKNVDIKIKWQLRRIGTDGEVSAEVASEGVINSTSTSAISLNGLIAGNYRLSVAAVDSSLADSVAALDNFAVYSLRDNTMPDDSRIFVPRTLVDCPADGKVEILYGTPVADTYVYIVTDNGAERRVSVSRCSTGFHRLTIDMPEAQTEGKVMLFTVCDGRTYNTSIRLRGYDRRKLTLEGESMRDRLTPGSEERWTLKLSDWQRRMTSGGLIATMYNKALDALESMSWAQSFGLYVPSSAVSLSTVYNYGQSTSERKNIKTLKAFSLSLPDFDPALNPFYISNRIYGSRARMYNKSAMGALSGAVAELAVEECEEEVTADAAALMPPMAADNAVEIAEAKTSDGGNAAEPQPEAEFAYRDSEVLQGFWMPELVIGADGKAELTFTVPDAVTTWAVKAFAWTDDLRAAAYDRDFVASKPVMVIPQLPRFLRTGDKARVVATVYNNSGERAAVNSVIELFDTDTRRVISSSTVTDSIAADGSALVSIDIEAPAGVSSIGYRVRSTLGAFTDGEQSAIAILPATEPVIESKPFYLNPGDSVYTTDIADGKDLTATLDYTDNPAWTIITQLPGLAKGESVTATGAAARLFGAATAAGLVRDNKDIASVLKAWSTDPSSTALLSRLTKDESLKVATLDETPWVEAAASDTRRMARLALLLDPTECQRNISRSIETLKKLNRNDGGWAWGDWSDKSSQWVTNIVLQNLGRLKSAGYLPDDKALAEMIDRAIDYYVSSLDERVKTDRALTFIASMFPEHKFNLRGDRIIKATLQSIATGWQKGDLWSKACDALMLNSLGYKSTARQILTSISQFGQSSKDKGLSLPSVKNVNDYADILWAYGVISPEAKEIDSMRQWLVLRAQATDDLGSTDPTRLIAAFAKTGSRWLKTGRNADISIDGRGLKPDSVEYATGHIVMRLAPDATGKSLTINRLKADAPAYGAVISQYEADPAKVKAVKTSDLSVEKRLTALRDGRWQFVDEVKAGERIRVLLTIKNTRDLEYVTVIDRRAACLEPVDQLPGMVWSGSVGFYRENLDSSTNLFINYLPKGTWQLTVEMTASLSGTFTTGICTVQSQLAPSITAHSAGARLICR